MTQLRCKPGDLAMVIVGGPNTDVLVGTTVEVMHECPREPFKTPQGLRYTITFHDDRFTWLVHLPHPLAAIDHSGRVLGLEYIPIPDSDLLPIRPEADPLEMTRDEAVPA